MREPDIVWRILETTMQVCPALTLDVARNVERVIRDEFGGARVQVPKLPFSPERGPGRPPLPDDVRKAAYQAALRNLSTSQIVKQCGLSRSSLYRLLKKPPPK